MTSLISQRPSLQTMTGQNELLEWIVKRTGIKTRYWAKEQTTSDLATIAAKRLAGKSNISPESIEFIIVATMTLMQQSPSARHLYKGAIGGTNAFAFDVMRLVAICLCLINGIKNAGTRTKKIRNRHRSRNNASSLIGKTAQRLFSLRWRWTVFLQKMKSHFYYGNITKMMDRNLRH